MTDVILEYIDDYYIGLSQNHGVHVVSVPCARTEFGFTLLFEALVLKFAITQVMLNVADLVGEHDTHLWRFFKKFVSEARELENYLRLVP